MKKRNFRVKDKPEIEALDHKPDIRQIKDEDWESFEDFYTEAVNAISVPYDLNPKDILRINSEIDQVYSIARFDYAYCKSREEKLSTKLSNAKKTAKLTFKKQSGQTNDDRDALITQFLETHLFKGEKEPLIPSLERWTERKIFMEAVIDTLLKKQDMMVNGNGALKLDAQGRGDRGE